MVVQLRTFRSNIQRRLRSNLKLLTLTNRVANISLFAVPIDLCTFGFLRDKGIRG